jgi:hypothetical protein
VVSIESFTKMHLGILRGSAWELPSQGTQRALGMVVESSIYKRVPLQDSLAMKSQAHSSASVRVDTCPRTWVVDQYFAPKSSRVEPRKFLFSDFTTPSA